MLMVVMVVALVCTPGPRPAPRPDSHRHSARHLEKAVQPLRQRLAAPWAGGTQPIYSAFFASSPARWQRGAKNAQSSVPTTIQTPPLPAFHNLTQLYARPGFLLRRAHQISAAVFEDECRSLGLTPAQFGALSVLHASPGLDQSSLARALGFDKVTMLRVLRGLETRGLIARVRTPENRRNLSISLAPAGLALLQAAQQPSERAYGRLMAPLDAVQQTQLVALLQLLTAGLEGEARASFVPPNTTADALKSAD